MSSSTTFDVIVPLEESLIVMRSKVETRIIIHMCNKKQCTGCLCLARQHNSDTEIAVSSSLYVPKALITYQVCDGK